MTELELKYGCNPNQKPSRIFMRDGEDLPITVLNGKPGYINFLDAFNSWQLVRELNAAAGLPAAASFKHVSPAGAAVGLPLSETDRKMYFVEPNAELSPIACAYIRARTGCVPMEIGPRSPMSATPPPRITLKRKSPTASSPPAIPTKPFQSSRPRRRGITTWSRSTRRMSPRRRNIRTCSA